MRVLADENVPRAAVDALRDNGHDVLWARTDAPGKADAALLTRAQRERRVIVTFDKDFGELTFQRAADAGAGVVLFRLQPTSPDDAARTIVSALGSRADWSGLFAVVEPGRIRIITLQPEGDRRQWLSDGCDPARKHWRTGEACRHTVPSPHPRHSPSPK